MLINLLAVVVAGWPGRRDAARGTHRGSRAHVGPAGRGGPGDRVSGVGARRAGAAIPSSSTRGALRTTCSSPATISLPTKTCAASRLKYPTPRWATQTWACGLARWTAWAGNGFRRTAARGRRKLSSLPGRRPLPTSRVSRRMMPVSLPSSRTRCNTQVAIRPRKAKRGRDTAAAHPALRSHARGVLPEQWPNTH